MRTQRRKLKESRAAHSKPLDQSATLDQLEHRINTEDFARMENEGGSNSASSDTLAAELQSQSEKPAIATPV